MACPLGNPRMLDRVAARQVWLDVQHRRPVERVEAADPQPAAAHFQQLRRTDSDAMVKTIIVQNK